MGLNFLLFLMFKFVLQSYCLNFSSIFNQHNMTINIRQAIKEDMEAVHALIRELALYENAAEQVSTTAETFAKDGFTDKPLFYVYVAEVANESTNNMPKIVGCALFFFAYSTWKGKIVYLDDLVVTQSYRRQGIGELLLRAVWAFARKHEARQVRWHVLDWNEPAIKFYKKLNVELDPEWITCRYKMGDERQET